MILILPVPVPVNEETSFVVLVVSNAVPPLRLTVSPLVADKAAPEVCVITLPLAVDAVNDTAAPAVMASLKAIVDPDKVREPTLVPVVAVVMAPALVTLTLSDEAKLSSWIPCPPLSRLIEPVPVPVKLATLLEVPVVKLAVPPFKLTVKPEVAVRVVLAV